MAAKKWELNDINDLVIELTGLRTMDIESTFLQLITTAQNNLWENCPEKIKQIKAKGHVDYETILKLVERNFNGLPLVEAVTHSPIIQDDNTAEQLLLLSSCFIELRNELTALQEEVHRAKKVDKPKIAIFGLKNGLFHNIKDCTYLRADLFLVGPGDGFPLVDYAMLPQSVDFKVRQGIIEKYGQARTHIVNGDLASFRGKIHELANLHFPSN
jgi:hypothetical protein